MQNLSRRTENFSDSTIRRMTRIAAGYDAINLSQGFPDFPPPAELMQAMERVSHQPEYQQYAVLAGSPLLTAAIARKCSRFMGIDIPQEDVTMTCGSTEAMTSAIMAITDIGDTVVVFNPYYENYIAESRLCGAKALYVDLNRDSTFSLDAEKLEDALRQHPKALILNNPSNPCGKVFTYEELKTIAELVRKYDVYVITDETYEHIVYAPNRHTYFASRPGMYERTICCSSLSKSYSITGWRLGYTIARPEITDRIRKVHDFFTIGAAHPLQVAAVTGLEMPQSYYDDLIRKYTAKRELLCSGLETLGLNPIWPQGSYFVMCDISSFGYDSDMDFCVDMIEKVGVAAVPCSIFYNSPENRFIRFHFAKLDETLYAALDRLERIRILKK